MAWVFVRLKLALLVNGFRRGWHQSLGIIVAAVYALPLSLLLARMVGQVGRRSELQPVAEPLLVILFCVFWLGWIIGPLLAFGMDETLDPGRLRLLPLRRRQRIMGLLAASAVGIGPLATMIVLYGAAVGYMRAGLAAVLVGLALLAQFLLCVTTSRAITTALSRRLASRRGRDILTVAAAMAGLGIAGLAQLPRLAFGEVDGPQTPARVVELVDSAAASLSLLPPAWAARAVGAAARGEIGVGTAWLVAAVGAVALLLAWWSRGLGKALDGPGARHAPPRDADLFPLVVTWLPRTRLGAGIAKDLRYAWRVPQQRVQYMLLGLVMVPFAMLSLGRTSDPLVVLLSPVALVLLGTAGLNMFGVDRGAVWLLDATGPRPRTDLLSKCAASTALGVPLVAVVAVALAAMTGGWSYVPVALLLAVAVQAVVLSLGVVLSVLAPFPLPDSPTNLFAANAGAGCTAVLLQTAGVVAQVVLLAPVAVAVGWAVLQDAGWLPVAVGLALLWGVGLWLAGLSFASRRMARRGPEFITALQPRST